MPFKSWGTIVPFEQYYYISFTDFVPAGKTIGIYGYQPVAATLSSQAFATLQAFDLGTLASAIQAAIQCQVAYMQLSWNEPGGTQVTDLVLGLVIFNNQDIDGVQQILNTIFSTALGPVLTEAHMNQLNAWLASRLNEAPPIDWLMVAGIGAAVVIGVCTAVALSR